MFYAGRNVCIFESLRPGKQGSASRRRQRDGQAKFWLRHMLHHHLAGPLNLGKDVFVGVVAAVGPMHHKRPAPAGCEITHIKGVAEAGRSPPAGQSLWVGKCGEYLRGRGGNLAGSFKGGHGPPGYLPYSEHETLLNSILSIWQGSFTEHHRTSTRWVASTTRGVLGWNWLDN